MTKREATMEALVNAAIALLGEQSVTQLTVKAIAARAGVNHGLVHHYFGSKEGLLAEAIRRSAERLYAGQPAELRAAYTFRFFREHPELIRILARVVLDGSPELLEHLAPPPERFDGWMGQIGALLERIGLKERLDPIPLNAFLVAAMMGWIAFRPMLREAFRVDAAADDAVEGWLVELDAFVAGQTSASAPRR